MYFKKMIFLFIGFFLICPIILFAQERQFQSEGISMDFKDANLKDVLKIFSIQSGLNFIASEEIEDRTVTLYLENVSAEDALNSILRANNLTYEREPVSEIFIVREADVPEIDTITRIYTLNYARVKEESESNIKEIIERMLSEHGKIMVDKRTNSLIIKDIPIQFLQIEKVIARLDTMTPQVMIEAEIIETTMDMARFIGTEWGGLTGEILTFSGPRRTTGFPFPDRLTKDVAREVTLGIFSASELRAILKFMEREGEARFLARPRILTLNNETATISIMTEESIARIETVDPVTGRITHAFERQEVGTILNVTPTINEEGFVTMLIEPEVSRTKVSRIDPDTRDPKRRSASAKVMVRDGETVVIGGLKSTESIETYRKVPLLGDIPILGFLFRSEQIEKKETHLMVFVTPHIVMQEHVITKMEDIVRESIPPSRTRGEEIRSVLDELVGP